MTLFRPGEMIPRKCLFKTPGNNRRVLEHP
jgi:hypothetical protein